ncbi:uncharacterized protein LOC110451769 [Mizuhopecten yessoensis]|uniref:Uncharacterized protein n=1 Tax=Mizuhopecten yessoensis TaxID=6573 RepID=A0A210QLI6_MIZYE|nr:uncharacterized protein LOC110451769 [Mizuhopecten yessoensis]OWF49531.1 hypothetical protein KP79_PYT17485 [Mizuhopecten yessoensis]
MADFTSYVSVAVFLLCVVSRSCNAQAVNACPSYACNPRGTNSYTLSSPNSSQNAYVAWKTDFFIGPLPNTLGCVGNPNNIVCQSNGPKDVGYISLDVGTGSLEWASSLLRFPVLPIMDIFGDIIGTDGHYLVKIEDSGKTFSPIKIADVLFPMYSLLISANSLILLVSKSGAVIVYETEGIPEASIWLTGTVQQTNGTFLPIAMPIIHENRCYVLTEFKPDEGSPGADDPSILGMQRLYAIDMFQRMVDRLHITWYFNFERETGSHKQFRERTGRNKFVEEMDMDNNMNMNTEEQVEDLQPSVMFNVETNTVMVNLPPPEGSNAGPTLWGLKDNGDTPTQLFRATAGLKQMAMFDTSTSTSGTALPEMTKHRSDGISAGRFGPFPHGSKTSNDAGTDVWAVLTNLASIVQLSPLTGAIQKSVDVSTLLKVQKAQITSNLMVARSAGSNNDVLIFGVEVAIPPPNTEEARGFVLLCEEHGLPVNLSVSTFVMGVSGADGTLVWLVPLPDGLKAGGQITGIPLTGPENDDLNDILVVFAGNDKSSTVLAISSH